MVSNQGTKKALVRSIASVAEGEILEETEVLIIRDMTLLKSVGFYVVHRSDRKLLLIDIGIVSSTRILTRLANTTLQRTIKQVTLQ